MNRTAIGCKVFAIFFFGISAYVLVNMGLSAHNMEAPIVFVIAPVGMAVLLAVFCIIALTVKIEPHPHRSSPDYVQVYRGGYGDYVPPAGVKKVIYQVPSQCPRCGASVSSEKVDWVGPLQVACPYCHGTMDVVEREL